MKTPIQELIEQLKKEAQFISDNDHIEDRMWRNGMREAIERAESLLEKEKDLFCQFAKIYDDDLSRGIMRKVQDAFDETFRNNESAM